MSYQYNNQGLLNSATGFITQLDYNEMGQVLKRTYYNGLNSLFEYNSSSFRLSKIKTDNFLDPDSPLQELEYSYDFVGNVKEIRDGADGESSIFTYDDLDRLKTAERGNTFDVSYSYDSIGNMNEVYSGDESISFVYGDRAHAPAGLIIGHSLINFTIDLFEGWNLISIPLRLENETLPAPFESIEGRYTEILAYPGQMWGSYKPSRQVNSLEKINETMGFWINMLSNHTFIISGIESDRDLVLSSSLNLVGYPMLNSSAINATFSNHNISSVLMYNNSMWYSYAPDKPDSLNTLRAMEPGYGYWVKVKGGGCDRRGGESGIR
ncbi:MAG: hypothetical protein KKC75_04275 [Nanoarchaeota archaeon]|nr:hypothetical protein [Nanoarchaeota archaeon]MBU1005373.1 hypothetical protein [Nanoarchaeota archaeon]MBU1946071.1 hypothetical protein [Nanoarchaeota archaeon]